MSQTLREALQACARNGQYVQDNAGNTYYPRDVIAECGDDELARAVAHVSSHDGRGAITYLDDAGYQVGGDPVWQIVDAEEVAE